MMIKSDEYVNETSLSSLFPSLFLIQFIVIATIWFQRVIIRKGKKCAVCLKLSHFGESHPRIFASACEPSDFGVSNYWSMAWSLDHCIPDDYDNHTLNCPTYIHIFHAGNKQILMLWETFAEMIQYFSLKAILRPTFPIPAQKKKRAISQRWKNEKLYKESSDLVSKFLTSKYINQSNFNFFLLHVLYVDKTCI